MSAAQILPRPALEALIAALAARGHRVIGPRLRDGIIVYDDIAGMADLPAGWGEEQAGGRYRLHRRDDDALFGHTVAAQSWKRFLHPPEVELWRARRTGDGFEPVPAPEPGPPLALIGVRGCDLAAIRVQDRVLSAGRHPDPVHAARRKGLFIVAVNCGTAADTCFCPSMGTGPRAGPGFDLCLTELGPEDDGAFLLEVGSAPGQEVAAALPLGPAEAGALARAEAIVARTATSIRRRMPAEGVPELLMANLEHPRWDETAARCLACGNCTMVCPTCFCTAVEDTTDLSGTEAIRTRHWASCFTLDFSHVHGGPVRASGRARYRQWLTHKLATWHAQFGGSGCTGCGRCITWCPTGIDLTEEVAALATPSRTEA
jgi:ferredoxin